MANLALVFDLIGRDVSGSKAFKDVGNAAEKAGKQGEASGGLLAKGLKLAGGALLGAGLIEGFKSLYEKAEEAAKVGRQTNAVLASTGGAAHETAKGVDDLARAISDKTGIDHVAIQSGENLLLTFTNIRNETGKGNDIFNQATQAVTDMSVALGQDMKSSAIQLGKALNDPIKGLTALQRVGVQFTESQKDQIKTLVASGQTLEAQKIILGELTKEFGGSAAAASTPLEKLKTHMGDLAEEAGKELVPAINAVVTFLSDHLLPVAGKVVGMFGGALSGAIHVAGSVLGALGDVLSGVVNVFDKLPGPVQAVAAALGLLAAAKVTGLFTGLASLGETAALRMLYLKDAIAGTGGLSVALQGAQAAGSKMLNFFGGPWVLGIAAAAGLVYGAVKGFQQLTGASDDAKRAAEGLAQSLTLTDRAADMRTIRTAIQNTGGLVEALQKAGVSSETAINGLLGQKSAQEQVTKALQDYINLHPGGVHSSEATAALLAKHAYEALATGYGNAASNARFFAGTATGAKDATKDAGDAADAATPKLEYLGNAIGLSADEVKDANKTWEDWIKNLASSTDAFVDPLKTYQDMAQKMAQATADSTKSSKDSWSDYIASVKISLTDYATQLEKQLTDQENWRQNIVRIAQRGGIEVAQQFAAMGEQGAGLTAQMADATDANFSRMATDMATKAAMGGTDAAANLDEGMRIMAEAGKEGAQATVVSVATQLGIGADEVYNIAQQYGINLASGINPVLAGLGKPTIGINTISRLGVIGRNADGGFIAGPGSGTSDSILSFLSNGEFVVNAAATARHRALLEAMNGAPRFAGGGFISPADVPHPYSTAPFRFPMSTPADAGMSTEYDDVTAYLRTAFSFTGGGGGAGSPFIRILGQSIAAAMGFGSQFNAIDYIFSHESGWNPLAQNPTSTAFGIPQFLNSTWAAYGGKTTDAAQQIRDGIMYMRDRYGSPNAAASFWAAHHWYDQGGWLQPGYTLAYNGTGKPERVIGPQESAGSPQVNFNFNGPVTTQDIDEFARQNAQRTRRVLSSYAVRT